MVRKHVVSPPKKNTTYLVSSRYIEVIIKNLSEQNLRRAILLVHSQTMREDGGVTFVE